MKKFVTLLLCMLPVSLFAQVNDGIRQAMDNYDYETVVMLIEPDCQDSLLLITKAQALKAMNRYPEAIGVLNSLILKDSTNTKVLIDLAECYKLTGNSRRAANCYQKAMNLQPENKFFRLQFIRSLLASEDYEEARTACHGWLERDSLSATGYKYLGQAYEAAILSRTTARRARCFWAGRGGPPERLPCWTAALAHTSRRRAFPHGRAAPTPTLPALPKRAAPARAQQRAVHG